MSGQEVSVEKTSMLFSNNVVRSDKVKLLHISGFWETNHFGKYQWVASEW